MMLLVIALLGATVLSAADFVAFSLREAARHVERVPNVGPTVEKLAGISRPVGAVLTADDLILFGTTSSSVPAARLDDVAVCFRSVVESGIVPEVDMAPTLDTPRTGMLKIAYKGIEFSHAGAVFAASDAKLKDCLLKDCLVGQSSLVPPQFQSYWDLFVARAKATGIAEPGTTIAYLSPTYAIAKKPGISVLTRLSVDVHVLGDAWGRGDELADQFRAGLLKVFPVLAAANPEDLLQLETIFRITAIAHWVREVRTDVGHSYWNSFKIPHVRTPTEHPLAVRMKPAVFQRRLIPLNIQGGVTAAGIRLLSAARDPSILRDLVLSARPSPDALFWPVHVPGWPSEDASTELSSVEGSLEHQPGTVVSQMGPLGDSRGLAPNVDKILNHFGSSANGSLIWQKEDFRLLDVWRKQDSYFQGPGYLGFPAFDLLKLQQTLDTWRVLDQLKLQQQISLPQLSMPPMSQSELPWPPLKQPH